MRQRLREYGCAAKVFVATRKRYATNRIAVLASLPRVLAFALGCVLSRVLGGVLRRVLGGVLRRVLGGVLVGFPAALIAATPGSLLNQLAVPDNATLAIVSTEASHNGVPIAMATLTSSESVDSVLMFYRNLWNDGDASLPGHIESAFDNVQLISRLRDGMNIVIQLETITGNAATGFVSVLALNAPQIVEDHGAFSDLDTLSSNRSVDGADTSWMRVYASPSSASRTHELYLKRLGASGWHVLADNEVQGAWVTQLGRNNMRLEVSFLDSREYASVVVAHQVISK